LGHLILALNRGLLDWPIDFVVKLAFNENDDKVTKQQATFGGAISSNNENLIDAL